MDYGPPLGAPQQPKSLLDQARQQYPILNNYDMGYKYSPGRAPFMLESWMPGMQTSIPGVDRPPEFPLNKMGIEVFDPKTKPLDVLGDVVSHHMVNTDPNIASTYQNFTQSLQPWQHDDLRQQYEHAKARPEAPEDRSFEQWRDVSGLPAYFRGYPFQQWDDAAKYYTPEQRSVLDSMMAYLRGDQDR